MALGRFDVQITGADDVLRKLQTVKEKWPLSFAAAVFTWATDVISTAMKLTPVDTGYLRDSRYLARPIVAGESFEIEGGFGAPYASWVHEIQKAYAVGEWKFLSKAIDYHMPSAMAQIASRTMRLAATGTGLDGLNETHPRHPMGGGRPKSKARTKVAKRGPNKGMKVLTAHGKKIEASKARNRERIAAEVMASLAAQREGRAPIKPGRGRPKQ